MTSPGMTPERLPTELDAAYAGRYASVRKHIAGRAAGILRPSDEQAKPDRLLSSGVFIPDHK